MPRVRLDLTGQKFGRLTVVSFRDQLGHGNFSWNCECSCGKWGVFPVQQNCLRSGQTKSCGCIRIEKAAENKRRHVANQRHS